MQSQWVWDPAASTNHTVVISRELRACSQRLVADCPREHAQVHWGASIRGLLP